MSDAVIIRAEKLTKAYRLHRKPHERIFSLFRNTPLEDADPASVHYALRGVDLEIRRGEKVAIIGRNGAGKSTLLKLVTRAIEPTSGRLEVRGKSHALLSLGAGFHPDFTGRENAYSFLAHMGLAGAKADALVADAVAFAELEEYIDQPIKTYSTGMQARLMFAVSTALEPDLLVIDEVLGVGDAYFQNKSFERIRELCSANNTTLLLVSHDIYSAAKLCPRIIWIDKGRVQGDGEATEMLKRYEDSIRLQEDARQKHKLALAFRQNLKEGLRFPPAFLEIRARNNAPAASPVHFAEMTLQLPNGERLALPILGEGLAAAPLNKELSAQLMPHSPWGRVEEIDGRRARAWNNFGAVEHKAGVVLFALSREGAQTLDAATLVLTARANEVVDADVVYIAPSGEERIIHRLVTAPRQWQTVEASLAGGSLVAASAAAAPTGRQGSGGILATGFRLSDGQQSETFVIRHGGKAVFSFDVIVNDPKFDEFPQIIFAFRRNGVEDVCRAMGRTLRLNCDAAGRRIEATFDRFPLGVGNYALTVMIAREGYHELKSGQFYSINPDVYDCHANCLEFSVVDTVSTFSSGTGAVIDCDWRLVEGRGAPNVETDANPAAVKIVL